MSASNSQDENDSEKMKCCCGRSDCAFLEHNYAALGGLERDLETAARLGQALLARHESYISESQAERARMSTCIADLEEERSCLQSANEKIVAENRELLEQLEQLNGSLSESDQDVKKLENLLLDCELEVKRLNNLVRRTEELDVRLQEMERERHSLNKQMEEGYEETRSTLARWRESERKVRELEDDVKRIELEAQADREKHEQIVARLEKERALERELGGAEGRLKGAAAINSIGKGASGSKTVVSHFVRDILQDNANLQAGIEELRGLLQTSNEEVHNLREQIMLHQPVAGDDDDERRQILISLEEELQTEKPSSKSSQQAVHVHHHYHAKLAKARNTMTRRAGKRKAIMPPYINLSEARNQSTTGNSNHHTFNSVPHSVHQQQHNRWSMQSTATMSSVLSSIPSSPRSYFDRNGFIFDRLDQGEESSRPTSPESIDDTLSPAHIHWKNWKDKENLDICEEEEGLGDDMTKRSPLQPILCIDKDETNTSLESDTLDADTQATPIPVGVALEIDKDLTPKPSILLQSPQEDTHGSTPRQSDVHKNEEVSELVNRPDAFGRETLEITLDKVPNDRPSLARKGSHETLVSISGMDIHLAQRPSASNTLELLHSHFAHSPSQARKVSTGQPLASVTEYTAISVPASTRQYRHENSLRHASSSIEALNDVTVAGQRTHQASRQVGAIGRLGGWVRGKWGIAPAKSSGNLRAVSQGHRTPSSMSDTVPQTRDHDNLEDRPAATPSKGISNATASLPVPQTPVALLDAKVDPVDFYLGRSPGVNQPGFIAGFRAASMHKRTPTSIITSVIDEEALKEGLAE